MFLNTLELSGFSGNIKRKKIRWNTYVTITFLFWKSKLYKCQMSEAAAQCFEIFSENSLVSICDAVLTSVKYLTGLR